MSARPHFLEPLLDAGPARHVLRIERSGALLATHLEPAFDAASRRTGLLGRESMGEDAAMIIAPCASVHTFFMKFAIDLVFVDRTGLVLKRCAARRPWRIALAVGAFAVVELSAGALDRSDLRTGDRLLLERVS